MGGGRNGGGGEIRGGGGEERGGGGGRIMKYKIPLHKSMHYLSLTSPLTMGVQLFSIRLAAS